MIEFNLKDGLYRTRRICAYEQYHLWQVLRSVLPEIDSAEQGLWIVDNNPVQLLEKLTPLAQLEDEQLLITFRQCVASCEKKQDDAWVTIEKQPYLGDMLRLISALINDNFLTLLTMERPQYRAAIVDKVDYVAVHMPKGEDWLFRPVDAGWCKLIELYDGTLQIEHIAKANDYLNVRDENEYRIRKAVEKSTPAKGNRRHGRS